MKDINRFEFILIVIKIKLEMKTEVTNCSLAIYAWLQNKFNFQGSLNYFV